MPVTTDTIIVAQALASARSLVRAIAREPRDFGALRDLSKIVESELDGALEALKRVEDRGLLVPLLFDGEVIGEVSPEVARQLATGPSRFSMGVSVRG